MALLTLCQFLALWTDRPATVPQPLLEHYCEVPVAPARPLFCTACADRAVPYESAAVKTVARASGEIVSFMDITETPESVKLKPQTVVLHQWTILANSTEASALHWSAGLASHDGADILLWRPDMNESAIHLPESREIAHRFVMSDGDKAKTPRKRGVQMLEANESLTRAGSGTGISEVVARPEGTLDLLYFLDDKNVLKVDAWVGGKYQGFFTTEVRRSGPWEPVFLMKSTDREAGVLFASTAAQALRDLDLRSFVLGSH